MSENVGNVVFFGECLFRQNVSKTSLNANRLLFKNRVYEHVCNHFLAKTVSIPYKKNPLKVLLARKSHANFAQDGF